MDIYVEQSYFEELIGRAHILRVLEPYRSWVAALPQPLRDCCRDLLADEIVNSNLVNLPFLLDEPFGISDPRPIEELVVGNAFMLTYFLASDKLFDEPDRCHRFMILLVTQLHAEMMRRYERVTLGRVGDIWAQVVQDHVAGLIEEETHFARCRSGHSGLDLEAYEIAILKKNRYGMAVIPMLAAIAPQPQQAPILEQVYDHMAIEIEFDDDLKDWSEDLAAGHFTPMVQALTKAAGSQDEDAMCRALVTSPAISTILDRIDFHLGAAKDLLKEADLHCEKLLGYVTRHSEANQRLQAAVIDRQVRYVLYNLDGG